jgi:hypothetical protein
MADTMFDHEGGKKTLKKSKEESEEDETFKQKQKEQLKKLEE